MLLSRPRRRRIVESFVCTSVHIEIESHGFLYAIILRLIWNEPLLTAFESCGAYVSARGGRERERERGFRSGLLLYMGLQQRDKFLRLDARLDRRTDRRTMRRRVRLAAELRRFLCDLLWRHIGASACPAAISHPHRTFSRKSEMTRCKSMKKERISIWLSEAGFSLWKIIFRADAGVPPPQLQQYI